MNGDEPVGLIAGAGRLPFIAAEGIRRAGDRAIVLGIRGSASPELREHADVFAWVGLTRLGAWIRQFRKHGVRRAVMIGGVRKGEMHSRLRVLRNLPDIRSAVVWYRKIRGDKRDNAVLIAVADELAAEGIELISSVSYCHEHLADEGLMTRTAVPKSAVDDVEFGWRVACASADQDIGQTVAVREQDIIAVEAVEGTDEMIRRAGGLCPRRGWTLVKVARSEQDMRFDVPTVGPDTVRLLAENGCVCLVLEADRTLIVDKGETLALADEFGLAVLGRSR